MAWRVHGMACAWHGACAVCRTYAWYMRVHGARAHTQTYTHTVHTQHTTAPRRDTPLGPLVRPQRLKRDPSALHHRAAEHHLATLCRARRQRVSTALAGRRRISVLMSVLGRTHLGRTHRA